LEIFLEFWEFSEYFRVLKHFPEFPGIVFALQIFTKMINKSIPILSTEDHVWFEDRWMVASLCDE
jgi:hypothetical protein